jgi:hypothetical protein
VGWVSGHQRAPAQTLVCGQVIAPLASAATSVTCSPAGAQDRAGFTAGLKAVDRGIATALGLESCPWPQGYPLMQKHFLRPLAMLTPYNPMSQKRDMGHPFIGASFYQGTSLSGMARWGTPAKELNWEDEINRCFFHTISSTQKRSGRELRLFRFLMVGETAFFKKTIWRSDRGPDSIPEH